ncbi:hypothetical protein [Pedobacter glucosidilyticus]|uniref:hypothetical protein n=1 Tax=Pedobacter glucosidilyticus TaxID=1122941 RepID=UPI00042119D4|nr:hypothetical protein [Pedobacter glucosidilyticus]
MRQKRYNIQKLLAPTLFAIMGILIVVSFISDYLLSKLGIGLAIIILVWLTKNQTELNLYLSTKKLLDSKNDDSAFKNAFGDNLDWGFNSDDDEKPTNNFIQKSTKNHRKKVLLKNMVDYNYKKNNPEQYGLEIAQLENNESYSIANKGIFPN